MSYINEALRKAQEEKDSRYETYGGPVFLSPSRRFAGKRKWLVCATVMAVVLVSTVVSLTVYYRSDTPHVPKADLPELKGEAAVEQPPASEPAAVKKERGASSAEVRALYGRALGEQRNKNLIQAEKLYSHLLEMNPRHVEAMNNLGVIYMTRKQNDRAIKLFQQAIQVKNRYVDPYYNLACLYAQLKNREKSLEYLGKAIAVNGEVKRWARNDGDLKYISALPEFKKLTGGLQETTLVK